MLPAAGTMTGIAVQMMTRVFTVFARAAEVGSVAQLMDP